MFFFVAGCRKKDELLAKAQEAWHFSFGNVVLILSCRVSLGGGWEHHLRFCVDAIRVVSGLVEFLGGVDIGFHFVLPQSLFG